MSLVTATVTPAILILAAGSLVASTVVRLGRVADHTRALIAQSEAARREGKTHALAILEARMDRQLRRAELTRNALWDTISRLCCSWSQALSSRSAKSFMLP